MVHESYVLDYYLLKSYNINNISGVTYFWSVINDSKSLLRCSTNVSLLFIRGSVNSVAHYLAHYLARIFYLVADHIMRSEDISPEFRDVIVNDC